MQQVTRSLECTKFSSLHNRGCSECFNFHRPAYLGPLLKWEELKVCGAFLCFSF